MLETVQNLKGETLLKVVGYGFHDFIRDLEQGFEQGYRLDFESNENYPQQIGSLYTAQLVSKKSALSQVLRGQPEVHQEQETSQEEGKTQARGRKKVV